VSKKRRISQSSGGSTNATRRALLTEERPSDLVGNDPSISSCLEHVRFTPVGGFTIFEIDSDGLLVLRLHGSDPGASDTTASGSRVNRFINTGEDQVCDVKKLGQ
jgi:hypothetical protein